MSAAAPAPGAGPARVRLFGSRRQAQGYALRDFLSRSVVAFDWVELTSDADAHDRIGASGLDDPRLPVCLLPDGTRVDAATVELVASRLGWLTTPRAREYDVSIYGAGPAGLSAAVYAASEGLSTILVEREAVGGQAGTSSLIENFLDDIILCSGAQGRAEPCGRGLGYARPTAGGGHDLAAPADGG